MILGGFMTKSDILKLKSSRARAKELIEQIVKVLNEDSKTFDLGDEESGGRALWDILTALRGPDNGNYHLKEETTAKIRAGIGLKHGNVGYATVSDSKPLPSTDYRAVNRAILAKFPDDKNHFSFHYAKAIQGLTELGFLEEKTGS
jgi:hypothetical protein